MNPKFKVGDKVWYLDNFQPKRGAIVYVFKCFDNSFSYRVNEERWIEEHKLHKSKAKMLKITFDYYEQILAETQSILNDLKNALKSS